jgi:hypothetical protein
MSRDLHDIPQSHFDPPDEAPVRPYRAVSTAAVVSVVLGVLSLLTVFHWMYALIPIAGIMVGWLAQRHIRDCPQEVTGLAIAWVGLGLSVAMWGVGYSWLIFAHANEVPFGYQVIQYDDLQPDRNVAEQIIPLSVSKLDDKKVFLRGYIKPGRQQTDLKKFIICPSIANCPFCIPDPKPTEMILVTLTGDLTTDYSPHEIAVGGTFKVDAKPLNGLPYSIEADYVRVP